MRCLVSRSIVRRSTIAVLFLLSAASLSGQQKSRFPDLRSAVLGGGQMNGGFGPAGLTWIDGGKRYSYIKGEDGAPEEIRAFDPATGQDTLVFSAKGMTFPDSSAPFA